jgi:F-type H+-transporting ATPase subunit gamma
VTSPLEEVAGRIHSVQQLGAVLSAMRGVAASRVQQGRGLLAAIDTYAAVLARALAEAMQLLGAPPAAASGQGRVGIIAFCAEQGFAGGFSGTVLDRLPTGHDPRDLMLVGSRGAVVAAERRLRPDWQATMAPAAEAIPAVASRIADALYARMQHRPLARVEMLVPMWQTGMGLAVERRSLLPIDPTDLEGAAGGVAPLVMLPPALLVERLVEEYVFAGLCRAATHAFSAENEARLQAMAAARRNIDRLLETLTARERSLRQEAVTAEVIELAAVAAAAPGPLT